MKPLHPRLVPSICDISAEFAKRLAAPGLPLRHRMARITRTELQEAVTGSTPPVVLEVLPRPYWRKHHLPGALSLPPDQLDSIRELVPDTSAELVVYCWDDT